MIANIENRAASRRSAWTRDTGYDRALARSPRQSPPYRLAHIALVAHRLFEGEPLLEQIARTRSTTPFLVPKYAQQLDRLTHSKAT